MISVSMNPEDLGSANYLAPEPPSATGGKWVVLALVFFLAAAGLTFVVFKQQLTVRQATTNLDAAKKQSFSDGQADQHQKDEQAFLQQSETPYKSYIAPEQFGGFTIKYPKNWSAYSEENLNATSQVNLVADPDLVKNVANQDNPHALHVMLIRATYADSVKQHAEDIKQNKYKMSDTTVSGIKGTMYTGKFDGKHDGFLVLLPVRDKTIAISTDDKKYSNEYNTVLAQSSITP